MLRDISYFLQYLQQVFIKCNHWMTFFELSRVNIYVSIAGLGLWPALADNTYITLDYSGYHKLHPMNVYHSQCSNATMQLTAMKTITECYLGL